MSLTYGTLSLAGIARLANSLEGDSDVLWIPLDTTRLTVTILYPEGAWIQPYLGRMSRNWNTASEFNDLGLGLNVVQPHSY